MNDDDFSFEEKTRYAGFWIRFLAAMLDTVFVILLTLPFTLLIFGSVFPTNEEPIFMRGEDLIINWLLPAAAVIIFWIFKGATPGKMLTSLKIVDVKTGNIPSTTQSIIRYLAYYISIIPFFMGFLWIVFDQKKRGWHDIISGTLVIKTDSLT